jgi:protein O-GlcNAc transferase
MAWNGCANILSQLKRYDGALIAYDRALALDPDLIGVEGKRLHAKMHLGIWKNFDVECSRIILSVRNGIPVTQPFPFLALPSSSEDQLKCTKVWVNKEFPISNKPLWRGEIYDHTRIRVAYVSADFRDHHVSYLMAGMFESHYRSRFEVTAISLEADNNSKLRLRLQTSVDRFIDAELYTNDRIAKVARELEIDILIDLMGFTASSRPGMFAQGPAPIQVNYLGYCSTMGAKYVDYILADKTIISESSKQYYSEKVVYLPNSFLPNDSKRTISDRMPSRAEYGLPEIGFVFCSFNQTYKITPQTFDVWMRLLRTLSNSVLWLSNTS